MQRITNVDIPFAIPPGEMIEDELQARGVSIESFGEELGLGQDEVAELLEGRFPITDPLAIKIAKFFGTSIEIWKSLEESYVKARKAGKPELSVKSIGEAQRVQKEATGNVALRIPKSLHGRVRDLADRDGVSMNQYLLSLIVEGVVKAEGRRVSVRTKAV